MRMPKPGLMTVSLPPGAHAPIQEDLLTSWNGSSPVPPKQVQPSSSSAASLASAAATLSGGTWKRITWCTTSGLPGSTWVPVSHASFSSSGSSRKHR